MKRDFDAAAYLEKHWTKEDQHLASKEGWDIFAAHGSWEIQKNDCIEVEGAKLLESDEQAWVIVMMGETLTHDKARNFIRDANPIEWRAMLKFTGRRKSGNG